MVTAAFLPMAVQAAAKIDAESALARQLGLRAASTFALASVARSGTASATAAYSVPIDGRLVTLELQPHSNRAAQFLVQTQEADGSFRPVELGHPQTYRGTVSDIPGSVVGATIDAGGMRGRIILPDDSEFWIEPIAAADAETADHVIYRSKDVLPTGDTCIQRIVDGAAPAPATSSVTEAVAGEVPLLVTELAVDADFDYFTNFGDAALVAEDIETIVNLINTQYERDVQIRHIITRIIVRSSEPNVYSRSCAGGGRDGEPCSGSDDCPGGTCPVSVNAETLLETFANHWNAAHTDVPRDVAQLFTGKDLEGTTIGVAYVGSSFMTTVCGTEDFFNYGYSVVETDCTNCSLLSRRTDLSAHELGHNWGADHCACAGWTMNARIQGANRFHPTYTIPEITAYRDTRNCLDIGDEFVRLIVSADSRSVNEQGSVQLTAEADFRVGPNQDVTADTLWSVEPTEAGAVDASGVFTPSDVDAALCVRILATYADSGTEHTTQAMVTLFDTDEPLAVVQADPPAGAVDARQPCLPDGSAPTGWRQVTVWFNGEICMPSVFDFTVTSTGGSLAPPQVNAVERIEPDTYRLSFTTRIEPGAWTDVTHIETGATTRLGFLPADVNGDGVASPTDILDLIDALNAVGPERRIWSLDIDRSGKAAPTDILAMIDLLNGAEAFRAWNNVSLP